MVSALLVFGGLWVACTSPDAESSAADDDGVSVDGDLPDPNPLDPGPTTDDPDAPDGGGEGGSGCPPVDDEPVVVEPFRPVGEPAQFAAWGTAGLAFPPAPDGWSEQAGELGDPLPPFQADAEEEARGWVVFARDAFVTVPSRAAPAPSERLSRLDVFAAQGELEPVAFQVHALHALHAVGVEVGDLRAGPETVIPAEWVDVRVVRSIRVPVDEQARTYRWAPFLLERREQSSVEPGESLGIWLTVAVPDAAPAADYRGTVTVRSGDRLQEIPVRVRVLPFRLPPAPMSPAMYYSPRHTPGHDTPEGDALQHREMIDLRAHGMSSFLPAFGVEVVSRDRQLGEDDIEATRRSAQRAMSAAGAVWGDSIERPVVELGFQIACEWDQASGWFRYWAHSAEIDDDMVRAADLVTAMATQEGWPSPRFYLLDEAGGHGLLEEATHYYGLLKARRPELTTWTTIGGGLAQSVDEIGLLSDVVDEFTTNRLGPDIAQALEDHGQPYGIYNGARRTPISARYFFGFWAFKTGASQVSQWVYHWSDGIFDGGLRLADEGFVYHGVDGPLPSLLWEAVREGVDDQRYIHQLRLQIEAARQTGDPGAVELADQAQATLDRVLGRMDWGFQAARGGTSPPTPSRLRQWRSEIVEQILALWESVGSPGAQASPNRISPLDQAWASPPSERPVFGPELSPQTDFEGAMAPWSIQHWNGEGSGEVDAERHHGGERSVRIEVPESAGSNAVTVLVWNSPGLELVAGHRYELSAYVRWEGRTVGPDTRIRLSDNAAVSSADQDPPDDAGWARTWRQVEMVTSEQPAYLAIWVQGPGTVWVDDVSFREVLPAAISVTMDQPRYDGFDRVAIARVSLGGPNGDDRLRITLEDSDGGRLEDDVAVDFSGSRRIFAEADLDAWYVTAPSGDRRRIVLDPSALAFEGHTVRLQRLRGGESSLVGETATTFERIPSFLESSGCPPR